MQLKTKTSFSKSLKVSRLVFKILLPFLIIFVLIYLLGQIDLPSPKKIITKEIPNEKLIKLK